MTTTKTSFTLVELLVVIAIIGVLVALTVPAANKVLKKAQKTECASNLRQIGISLHLYLESNHFTTPSCTMRPSNPPDDETEMPGIAKTLLEFTNISPNIFQCPRDHLGYFKNDQSSYEWNSVAANQKRADEKNFSILGLKYPVMYDYEAFHDGGSNALYIEGHVSDLLGGN